MNSAGGAEQFPHWRDLPMVRLWEDSLKTQGWRVDTVRPLNVLARLNGDPLFALLDVRGKDPEGRPILPYVLVRGAASVIVPECVNRDTGERKLLMVLQRRVGDGTMSLEFPAGMVENGGDPAETALRELEEETGVGPDAWNAADLRRLWDKGLCTSPGLSDESVHFFSIRVTLDGARFRALEGSAAGHFHEGEHTVTTLKTPEEARAGMGSVLAMLGLMLHERATEIA